MMRRRAIAGAALAVLAVACGCTTSTPGSPRAIGSRPSGSAALQPPDKDVVKVDRPGFQNLPSSIGDPLALVAGPSGPVVQFAGRPVLQPCSVVSIEDVRSAGFVIRPNPLVGAVERHFLDGRVPESPRLAIGGKSIECNYLLGQMRTTAAVCS